MSAMDAERNEQLMIASGLRLWASSVHRSERALTEAAVELVIGAYGGRLADWGWPWVREGGPLQPYGLFWLNPGAMSGFGHEDGSYELRLLPLVQSLTGGRPVRRLWGLLAGLDSVTQQYVLEAFNHVAAAHRDVAEYAFGDDPWVVLGQLRLSRKLISLTFGPRQPS